MSKVEIIYLPNYHDGDAFNSNGEAKPLAYGTDGAAALDLRASMQLAPEDSDDGSIIIYPGQRILIPSGIKIHIKDKNLCAMILPRSGLGSRDGIILSNSVGLIDSDYQGEIGITVWNTGDERFVITPGLRICQLVFVPIVHPELVKVQEFSENTDRGENGFGSTGTK